MKYFQTQFYLFVKLVERYLKFSKSLRYVKGFYNHINIQLMKIYTTNFTRPTYMQNVTIVFTKNNLKSKYWNFFMKKMPAYKENELLINQLKDFSKNEKLGFFQMILS